MDSWISTGSNEPADPQKLGEALGPDTTQQLAAKTGLSIEALLPLLAGFLPMIIDQLSPGGQLPAGSLPANHPRLGTRGLHGWF